MDLAYLTVIGPSTVGAALSIFISVHAAHRLCKTTSNEEVGKIPRFINVNTVPQRPWSRLAGSSARRLVPVILRVARFTDRWWAKLGATTVLAIDGGNRTDNRRYSLMNHYEDGLLTPPSAVYRNAGIACRRCPAVLGVMLW